MKKLEEAAKNYASSEIEAGGLRGLNGIDTSKKQPFIDGANWFKSLLLEKLQVYKGAMILDGYEPEYGCIKFMNELIEEIKVGEYSSWISIEKRLPPVGTKVLVKTKNGNCLVSSMYIPTDCKGTVLGGKQWKGSGALKDSIVKWMPITE